MASEADSVAHHYTVSSLDDRILEALEAAGKDLDALVPNDLAAVDEFHIRGREATKELAQLAGVDSEAEVLDVGCGLGGSCRYLAAAFGCYATGLDLTEEYCRVATVLSDRVGLQESTEFRCASALDMPFPDESFDFVWTEHAQMNIRDKDGLHAEIARVLKRGGKFVFHDVFAGPGGAPHFPVPWAGDASISFLMDPEELRLVLHSLELEARHWEDVTEESLSWFKAALKNVGKHGLPPVGLHLLMGDDTVRKFENVVRNLEEQRIVVVQAVLRKGDEDSLL
jgi:ubiquinone/menaquinone biosynthesis C-methylase UbiE